MVARERSPKELGASQKIDRERKDLALRDSFNAVSEGNEIVVLADAIRYAFVTHNKKSRPIDTRHDVGHRVAFREVVSSHMVTDVEYFELVAGLVKL
jgi:hypothetical protein